MALGKQFVQGWTTAFIDVILAHILEALAGIEIFGVEPFAGLQAWSDELMAQAAQAFSTANSAQASAVAAQTTASYAQNTADGANTTASDLFFNVASNRPLWDGIDPTGESSFPWMGLAGDSIPTVTITSAVARFGFMRPMLAVEKKTITYIASTTGSVTGMFLDLYHERANGDWELLYSSANQSGNLTPSTLSMQQIAFIGVVVNPGEVYAVQFRMTGSGTVSLAYANMPYPAVLPGFEPLSTGAGRNPSTTPAPALISKQTMDTQYVTQTPYFQLGSDVGQVGAPRSWFESFDYGSWTNWVRWKSGTDDLQEQSGGKCTYGGSDDGFQACMYVQQVSTDTFRVAVDISNADDLREVSIIMCTNNDFTSTHARMAVYNGNSKIVTGTGMGSGAAALTSRATSGTGGNGHWEFEYNATTNTFRVFKGVGSTTPLMTWVDTGHVVSHGPGERFAAIMQWRSLFLNSGDVDNFTFKDVTINA